jgi:hypothetical protein
MTSSTHSRALGRRLRLSAAILLQFALVLLGVSFPQNGTAQSPQLPIAVQADLMVKVAGFDRNFRARAGDRVIVLLAAADDSGSMRAAVEMKSALSRVPRIADLPHEEQIVTSTSPAAIASAARDRRAAIVYFAPGYSTHIPAIREAFSSLNVLTVGAVPEYVPAGIVLGFDLVSGHPKLLVHVPQARKQQVAFPASVLNLMKVYQ